MRVRKKETTAYLAKVAERITLDWIDYMNKKDLGYRAYWNELSTDVKNMRFEKFNSRKTCSYTFSVYLNPLSRRGKEFGFSVVYQHNELTASFAKLSEYAEFLKRMESLIEAEQKEEN